jgi:glutamate-1-semialdehyde 2,1-aminomutase
MEAALMNMGVVPPLPGYLEAVREITRRHGVVWIVDEVKTGLAIAAGGATERFGLSPDLVTLAKALAAGLPSGAVGGTAEAMAPVRDGRVYQVGTYNGNPLAMAAARASLEHVLTPDAYRHFDALEQRILDGCRDALHRRSLPGYAVGFGAKGVVMFSPERIVDHVTYVRHQDRELTELAWLYAMNRGIFMTPGREEEWTLSVAHAESDVDRYVEVFDDLASEVAG